MTAEPALSGGELAARVGRTVRELRVAAGLSIAELGRRTGVSGAFVSQLEAGRSSVSIPTLYRIADALNVAPNALLPGPAADHLITRAGHGPTIPASESAAPQQPRLLTRSGSGVALEGFHYVINPGDDEQDWYRHAGEDLVYVLSGAIKVQFQDGREIDLSAGDSLHHDGEVPHRWVLAAESRAEVLVVVTVPPGS